ncbi:MAG: sensor domain-containing diguanylate cyclase, partial [Rubrivivax sp.]
MSTLRGQLVGWLARLRQRASLYDATQDQAAAFRAQQMQAVLRLTPLAMSIQLVCALVVPLALWRESRHEALLPWAGAITMLAVLSFRAWWQSRARPPRRTASPRSLRRVLWHALLLGSLWALLPLMTYDLTDPESRYLVGVLVTGMVCAGGFALAAVPVAGTLFVALVGSGAASALALRGGALAHVFAMQLAGYSAIVIYTVWASARMMAARMVAEARASHQSDVISLLLRDFEDHTTDLLWELDGDYRFVHVSPRLATVFGLSESRLRLEPALALLEELVPQEDEALARWAELKAMLTQRESFRDQILITRTATGGKWWSLSARRLADDDGRFKGWRGVASDITERQKAMQRLNWLAHNDALTGLVNRTQLRSLLEGLLTGDPDTTQPLALILLDLDGFKQVNDTQGHATGDLLLQLFGQAVQQALQHLRERVVIGSAADDDGELVATQAG